MRVDAAGEVQALSSKGLQTVYEPCLWKENPSLFAFTCHVRNASYRFHHILTKKLPHAPKAGILCNMNFALIYILGESIPMLLKFRTCLIILGSWRFSQKIM